MDLCSFEQLCVFTGDKEARRRTKECTPLARELALGSFHRRLANDMEDKLELGLKEDVWSVA